MGDSLVFNAGELDLLRSIASTILPRTETPGAIDLGLAGFVDRMVSALYDDEGKRALVEGLATLEQICQERYKDSFIDCEEDQKRNLLLDLEKKSPPARANIWGSDVGPGHKPDFYRQIKSLLLLGYFTDEKIGKEYLHYDPIPGRLEGCIDLQDGHRIDAL